MNNIDPLVWISLFSLVVVAVGVTVVEISSRRLDRKYGRRKG